MVSEVTNGIQNVLFAHKRRIIGFTPNIIESYITVNSILFNGFNYAIISKSQISSKSVFTVTFRLRFGNTLMTISLASEEKTITLKIKYFLIVCVVND